MAHKVKVSRIFVWQKREKKQRNRDHILTSVTMSRQKEHTSICTNLRS